MNRFITVSSIFYFSLFVLSGPCFSAEVLSTDELRDFQQKMKSANQLTVDFTQEKTVAIRPNKPSRSQGRAVFAKPTKFRWELPKSVLVFDGSNLYSFSPADKTATRFKTSGEKSLEIREVIDLVLDFDNLLHRYKLLESTKDGNKVSMRLQPKRPGSVTNLEISFDAATATVQGVTMKFSNKNVSRFLFSNPDRRAVDPASFAVPKDYKISEAN